MMTTATTDVRQQEDALRALLAEMREAGATNDVLIETAIKQAFLLMGEIASQNRVLDLVRAPGSSPSTVTIQKGIKRFWDGVRSRLGARLSHPEIPEDVLAQMGESLSKIWDIAVAGADSTLSSRQKQLEAEALAQRHACELQVTEAQALMQAAQDATAQANEDAAEARRKAEHSAGVAEAAGRDLAIVQAALEQAQQQIDEWAQRFQSAEARANQQRHEYEAALQALRTELESKLAAGQQAYRALEDKHANEVNRMQSLLQATDDKILALKLDIDREISRSEAMRKELQQERESSATKERRLSDRIQQGEAALNAAATRMGELSGQLLAITAERDSLAARLETALHGAGELTARLDAANQHIVSLTQASL